MNAAGTTHMEVIVAMDFLALGKASWLADPLVLLAGTVSVLLVIYLYVRRRGAPPDRSRALVMPSSIPRAQARASDDHDAVQPAQTLLSELEEATARMTAQVDARTARLETLIQEADVKLVALNAAVARAKSERITERLASGAVGTEVSGLAALSRHNEIYALADAGEGAKEIAQRLGRPSGEVELILALRGT